MSWSTACTDLNLQNPPRNWLLSRINKSWAPILWSTTALFRSRILNYYSLLWSLNPSPSEPNGIFPFIHQVLAQKQKVPFQHWISGSFNTFPNNDFILSKEIQQFHLLMLLQENYLWYVILKYILYIKELVNKATAKLHQAVYFMPRSFTMGIAAFWLIPFVSIILNINTKLKHCSGAYYGIIIQKASKYQSETKSNCHFRMYSWIISIMKWTLLLFNKKQPYFSIVNIEINFGEASNSIYMQLL